jgi:hypothetical protein
MTKDELKLAFQKAFQMGQDYWYYANHEFESYNKKSDAIRAKFNEMVKETIEEALAEPWEKFCDSNCVWTDHHPDCKLAQQEPVVWMYQDKSTHEVRFQKHMRGFVDHGATYETPLYATPPQRTWVGLMRGVRVEGDTVVISVKGGNDAARELCGALIEEMNR